MTSSIAWESLRDLEEGGHFHLDAIISSAPPPGSPDWFPIVTSLIPHLISWGGAWTVSVPLGTIASAPASPLHLQSLLELVALGEVREPPAVYRLANTLVPDMWEGEHHRWSRLLYPSVREVLSLSRSRQEIAANENLRAAAVFEVRTMATTR